LKAAEDAPLGVLLLRGGGARSSYRLGVLNVLTGLGKECGAPLASHPIGKLIMRAASDRQGAS
jgi:hypothetical protein